ncbi:MAG: iron-sulfur cluster insertion protein ErpA [Acidobacteria bacterium]|nr:MAG: iron-sulfur cluster insertion protein ErpA [Acidobacteriota bacterium]
MSIQPTENSGTGPAARPLMTITDAAIAKVREFAESNEEFRGKAFRVFVEGGGCSGFRYAFVFDDRSENDQTWIQNGVEVAIDPISMQYLRGATVDFVEDLRGSGFVVNNPNARGTCGCGSSFTA